MRIATHPDFQGMGYGTRAMKLLVDYYSGRTSLPTQRSEDSSVGAVNVDAESTDLLHETIAPRQSLPPLLTELEERDPEAVDYIGVSFGLTADLLRYVGGLALVASMQVLILHRFWCQKNGFVPVYLRQTAVCGGYVCMI